MRQDESAFLSTLLRPAGWRRAVQTFALAWVWPLATTVLVLATSGAVAVYASVWLVVPYLALMALILGVPGSGRRVPAQAHATTSTVGHPNQASSAGDGSETRSGSENEVESQVKAVAETAPVPLPVSVPEPEPTVVKTRRGKGRPRKARVVAPPAFEPTGATWVRVGPGKFVRADVVTPSTPEVEASDANPLPGSEPEPPVADSAVEAGPDPSEAAPTAEDDAGAPEFSAAEPPGTSWPEPETEETEPELVPEPEPVPATEPGAGDVEGEGCGDSAESGSLSAVSDGVAPVESGAIESRDNGNAPDAFEEFTPVVPVVDAGPIPPSLEPEEGDHPRPEPSAEPDAIRPEPVRGSRLRIRRCRHLRKGGATRTAWVLSTGDRRRGRSARVSGSRRHLDRIHRAGLSPHFDRAHPPRPPPCGSGRDPPPDRPPIPKGRLPPEQAGNRPFGRFPSGVDRE